LEFPTVKVIVWPLNDPPEGCSTSKVYLPDWTCAEAANAPLTQAETSTPSAATEHPGWRVGEGVGVGAGDGAGCGTEVAVGAGTVVRLLGLDLVGWGEVMKGEPLTVGVGEGMGVAANSARTVAWTRAVMVASVSGSPADWGAVWASPGREAAACRSASRERVSVALPGGWSGMRSLL